MENRKKPAAPVPDEPRLKTRPDDFEGQLASNDPLRDDEPVSPPPSPPSYGVEVPRRDTARK